MLFMVPSSHSPFAF
uniref:Uncharacterized protein n=1 Tax=Arundo donax TaxID=35708 RepID=A0A0A9HY26_ARUDO